MKSIIWLFCLLLSSVSITITTAAAGNRSAGYTNPTLTSTTSSLHTSTPSNGLPFPPILTSIFTAGPEQHATRHCNQSITTVTSRIKHDVPTPVFIFKTITVYTAGTTSADDLPLPISESLNTTHDSSCVKTTPASTATFLDSSSVDGTIPSVDTESTHHGLNTTHLPVRSVSIFARSSVHILPLRPLPAIFSSATTTYFASTPFTTGAAIGEIPSSTIVAPLSTSETSDTATTNDTATIILTMTAETTTTFVGVDGTANNEAQTTSSTLSASITTLETQTETTTSTSLSSSAPETNTAVLNETAVGTSTLPEAPMTTTPTSSLVADSSSFSAVFDSASSASSSSLVVPFNISTTTTGTSTLTFTSVITSTSSIYPSSDCCSVYTNISSSAPVIPSPAPGYTYINISTFIASGLTINASSSTADILPSLSSSETSSIVLSTPQHSTHHTHTTRTTLSTSTVPASTTTATTGAAHAAVRPARVFVYLARAMAFLDVVKLCTANAGTTLIAAAPTAPGLPTTCDNGAVASPCNTVSFTATKSATLTIHTTTTVRSTVTSVTTIGNHTTTMASNSSVTTSHTYTFGVHSIDPVATTTTTTTHAAASHLAASAFAVLVLVAASAWFVL